MTSGPFCFSGTATLRCVVLWAACTGESAHSRAQSHTAAAVSHVRFVEFVMRPGFTCDCKNHTGNPSQKLGIKSACATQHWSREVGQAFSLSVSASVASRDEIGGRRQAGSLSYSNRFALQRR